MQRLEQLFTQWYNRHHRRHGTPWEELFKSVPVEGAGETLATMAAYIDLNPVRTGLVEDPKDYRRCGHGAAVATGSASRPIRPIGTAPRQTLRFSAVLRSPALVVGDVLMDFDFVDAEMRFGTHTATGAPPPGWGLTAYSTSYGGTVSAHPAAAARREV